MLETKSQNCRGRIGARGDKNAKTLTVFLNKCKYLEKESFW